MFPSFTYPELQKKFCEGFLFYPFKSLEQYGGFIYKCYASVDNTQRTLDLFSKEYDFNSLHAQQLMQKLQQNDIPVGGELLYNLQRTGYRLEERFYAVKKRPGIYKQLLSVLETYHQVLAIFQHNVQQRIAAQLDSFAGLNVTADEGAYNAINEESLAKLQSVVREFLNNTDIIITFLTGCIEKKPDFKKLTLTTAEEGNLKDLIGLITSFRRQQKETYFMLNNWKKQFMYAKEQCTMN